MRSTRYFVLVLALALLATGINSTAFAGDDGVSQSRVRSFAAKAMTDDELGDVTGGTLTLAPNINWTLVFSNTFSLFNSPNTTYVNTSGFSVFRHSNDFNFNIVKIQ